MRCPKCYKELSQQSGMCTCGFNFKYDSLWTISAMHGSMLCEISSLVCSEEKVRQIGPTWGPSRPTFTNENPAPYAVYNSITNNVAVGDERSFVRIAERGSGKALSNKLVFEAGKQYVVSIYYHNNAASNLNNKEHNHVGIALDTRVIASFPTKLLAGEMGLVTGKIVANNTNPKEVWSSACITVKEDINIRYVTGSARIYNGWKTNKQSISRYLFSNEGVFIGLNELNGVILGCAEYSGQIAYVLQTEAA